MERPATARARWGSYESLKEETRAIRFWDEAYRHYKFIAVNGRGKDLWAKTYASRNEDSKGVFFDQGAGSLMGAIANTGSGTGKMPNKFQFDGPSEKCSQYTQSKNKVSAFLLIAETFPF